MSLENFTEIWQHSPQQGEKLLILLALANGTDHSGASMVHPGYVAKRARITEERLNIALDELEASGDIQVYANGIGCLGVNLLKPWNTPKPERSIRTPPDQSYLSRITGYVYLIQCGEYFKIGQSTNISRRILTLAIQLPHKPVLVHVIATDHHETLEHIFHNAFRGQRLNGEWFALEESHLDLFRDFGCPDNGMKDRRRNSHVVLDGKGFYVPQEFCPKEID